ncbi:pterin-4-alpha-carbinolamine dehydratase [Thiogranum longum]|uniref:Putative pterin-4-alpha-carbinolamine dehydratase n=1 Tax=Thiogranum longum TaxID=1537524 RepID=A0A4R1HBK3_9GAMM|nr:4a-hydroxytetrahydrobiopterin dehydratase [Thiogranum longum]TCK17903.1 pterin-4-alpha-carbinolamine dehydratase [Thiogranum longum]
MTQALEERHCQRETRRLENDEAAALMAQINTDWSMSDDGLAIRRSFRFDNYYRTVAFVNAVAWVVHREDHHPDLEVGYNRCMVSFTTHSVAGLSENDFICAARIDALNPDN